MTREDTILKMIVERYVATGVPVGSKVLVEENGLDCSSATVRNCMADLEKAGYIEKPHTAAGRVPTAKGYRYYMENLKTSSVEEEVRFAVAKILDEKTKSVEEVMERSCEILSDLTNLASAVLGSKAEEERLVSVQAVPIASKTATCLFVTDTGYVENKTFVLPEGVKAEDLVKGVSLLSSRLSGTPVGEIPEKMEALRPVLRDYLIGNDAIYSAVLEAFVKFAGERMSLYGKKALIDQPEFSHDADKMKRLISFLDDPEALRGVLEKGTDVDGVQVSLGDEKEGLEDLAIVSKEVNIPGNSGASISVLGPKRMDYARISAILKYMAQAIDEYFGKGGN